MRLFKGLGAPTTSGCSTALLERSICTTVLLTATSQIFASPTTIPRKMQPSCVCVCVCVCVRVHVCVCACTCACVCDNTLSDLPWIAAVGDPHWNCVSVERLALLKADVRLDRGEQTTFITNQHTSTHEETTPLINLHHHTHSTHASLTDSTRPHLDPPSS